MMNLLRTGPARVSWDSLAPEHSSFQTRRFCCSLLLVAQQKQLLSPQPLAVNKPGEFIPNKPRLAVQQHKLPFSFPKKPNSDFMRLPTLAKARCLYHGCSHFVQNNGQTIRTEVLDVPSRHDVDIAECHRTACE